MYRHLEEDGYRVQLDSLPRQGGKFSDFENSLPEELTSLPPLQDEV